MNRAEELRSLRADIADLYRTAMRLENRINRLLKEERKEQKKSKSKTKYDEH